MLGLTGDLIAPLGPLSEDEAVDVFVEQMEGLRDGCADVAWIGTLSRPPPKKFARRRWPQGNTGMPFTITRKFRHRRLYPVDGGSLLLLVLLVEAFDREPIAHGANCRAALGSSLLSQSSCHERRAAGCATLIAKAQRRRATMAWRRDSPFRHARIDGDIRGACRRLRRAHHRRLLRQYAGPCGRDASRSATHHEPGARPDLQTIVAALGVLAAPPAIEASAKPPARRRAE